MLELKSPTYNIKKQMLFNKLHITLLKFRSDWILHLEVSEFGFYPLKFGDVWILRPDVSEFGFYPLYF